MAQLRFKGPAKLAGISEFVMAQPLMVPEGQAGVAKRGYFFIRKSMWPDFGKIQTTRIDFGWYR